MNRNTMDGRTQQQDGVVRLSEPQQSTTVPSEQDASKQVTRENVTRLNTNLADARDDPLSSPEGLQSERSFNRDQFPLRGSSSAFLASLTSASDVSSPLTSAFPSTDSLQTSEPGKDGNMDHGMSPIHRDSMIEMALPSSLRKTAMGDDTTSTILPTDTTPPTSVEPPESFTTASSPTEYHYKTPTNHDRTNHDRMPYDPDLKTPSRTHTPTHSTFSTPGDRSRLESQFSGHQFYSSGKHDEEREQSHSKTPLLHPSDYRAPKETDQAVKDYSIMGNKLINNYEALKKLGSGAHGTVKLGRNTKDNTYVAIKIVRRYPKKPRLGKRESPEDKVKKEVAVLKKAQHGNVVSLLEVIDDKSLDKVYLVLEFVERGEIKWRKKTLRDIANFEMRRTRREMAGNLDENAETMELYSFNEHLLQQHLERQQTRSVTNSSASEGYADEHIFEEHNDIHNHYHIPSRHSSRPSSRPASRPPSELDISAAHTLRIPSRTSQKDAYSIAQKDSFSVDQDPMNTSMYGSYIEQETLNYAEEFERQRWLKDEPPEDQQWTPEEEEFRFVPCLTQSEALDVFRDTVAGLQYLHYHGIIHRDIKPANLLWTKDYRVKISDFGVSYLGRPLADEENENLQKSGEEVSVELAKTVGTPAFYAPELCDPDLFDPDKPVTRPQISSQIDVWALGVTLYAMIYGRLPFFDQNEFSMYEKIARQELFVPSKRIRGVEFDSEANPLLNSNKREEHVLMYEDVSEDLRDLIRRLLVKDPAKRITIKEVRTHPWTLKGLEDKAKEWQQMTDPEWKGDKIEISQTDLQEAVVPRGLFGKVLDAVSNITRGRVPSRRRAETSSKNQAKRISSSLSRSNTLEKDQRRASLKGDESTILTLLRSTRDHTDHPLSKSTVTTPTAEAHTEYFAPVEQVESPGQLSRPSVRTVTTADSILTVKAQPREEFETLGVSMHIPGSDSVGSSSSSLSKIIDGTREATRRFTSRVRSRDSQSNRSDNMCAASRASSGDNIALTSDGRSLKPSLAVSPALAAGHVELPASLHHPDSATSSPQVSPPVSASGPSTDSLYSFNRGRTGRKRASTASTGSWGQISPGFEETHRAFTNLQTPHAHQVNANHFLPLTSAISWSQQQPSNEAPRSTPAHAATSEAAASLLTTGETITPAIMKQKQVEREEYQHWRSAQQQVHLGRAPQQPVNRPTIPTTSQTTTEEEGEGSDDEGIVMGGKK